MDNIRPFHLAFPVHDLEAARHFYTEVLDCTIGRHTDDWIDFNLYGHQVVAHLKPLELSKTKTSEVDGHDVPVRHFGVILEWNDWEVLADKLKNKKIEFLIQPYVRFKDEAGEQATMFFLDPSGNALEFKAFRDDKCIFEAGEPSFC